MAYGKARRTFRYETPTTFSARDEFDQTAGALTGKTAPAGVVWAGAGDAEDFSVEAASKTAQRVAISDAPADISDGRVVVLGPVATATAVEATVTLSYVNPALGAPPYGGVVARYTDIDNFVAAYLQQISASTASLYVGRVVGGVYGYPVGAQNSLVVPVAVSNGVKIRLAIDANRGVWNVWLNGVWTRGGVDGTFGASGALKDGRAGLVDHHLSAVASTRTYDDFASWAPEADAVIHPNQSAEFRSFGDDPILREDSTGTYWGRPPESRGGRLWLPPAGTQGRTTRIAVLARRNDIETQPSDGVTDSTSVTVAYRPRWVAIPRQP